MIVVVTGASGALGGAFCRFAVARGDRVIAAVRRAEETRPLDALGAACLPLAFDPASPDAWARALATAEARLGPPGGAVLAAGAWRGGRPLHEDDDATFASMLSANLDSARVALRALLPGMIARRAGSVVVVGSRAAARPETSANAAAYAASKAALVAMAEAVAAEVRDRGVRVNAVLPSTIDTPANRAAMPDADAGRWVEPASLAAVIAFLLSHDARDVSGAAIPVFGRA